ncbi:MAG: hypothetical protein GC166_00425 [Alphaproteobacteria bacterium]|nr:hypothetical protein [Alphaproteobacteria bacterium]
MAEAAHVYDPSSQIFIVSTAILIVTYGLVVTERINRAVAALLGAGLVVITGILNQEEAVKAIDFNTLGLLAGMMMVVGVSKKSGLFGYVAVRAVQAVRGSPAGALAILTLVTAVFSALLDNVTTVLLIVPVTFVVCGQLKLPIYPFLFTEILASNIGGTSTLVGDPPNILIGSAAGLTFTDFVLNVGPIVVAILFGQMILNHVLWGFWMRASREQRDHVMALDAKEMITDPWLLKCSVFVIAAVTVAFILAHTLHLEPATIALFGAAVLLALESIPHPNHKHAELVTHSFHEVEWITLFFFIGLFVVIGGVEHAGLLQLLADKTVSITAGDPKTTAVAILWGSAVLSAIVDNIPFVATMIPLVKSLAPALGGEQALPPLWWALSLGACLGGNGTLVGASANLTVAGLAEKNGVRFSFMKFTLLAFPMMLASVAMAHIYLLWRYY